MNNKQFFQINTPNVISESIGGEVVIVNLEKGYYYSLVKTGATIWAEIEKGHSLEGIVNQIYSQYDAPLSEIQESVINFLEKLETAEIIIPKVNEDDTLSSESNTVQNDHQEKLKFEPPILETYTDMEELLLLDPIHEVDDGKGWPNPKN
jgi:hypothetical protein